MAAMAAGVVKQSTSWLDEMATEVAKLIPEAGTVPETIEVAAFLACFEERAGSCLLYTSPSPRDRTRSRMPSSA